jgi:hypothetical protein
MKILITLAFMTSAAMAQTPDFELIEKSELFTKTLNERSFSLSLDSVRVRTVLEAGVEIPLISDFALAPEVELYFTSK